MDCSRGLGKSEAPSTAPHLAITPISCLAVGMRITLKHLMLACSFTALSWLVLRHSPSKQPGPLSKTASVVTHPILVLANLLTPTWRKKPTYAQLESAYKKLRSQHEQLIWQYVGDTAEKQVARKTKTLRAFAERFYPPEHTLAQIIDSTITHDTQTIRLDKGSRHGITSGMLALYKRSLLGIVQHVYPYSCQIKLITDPSSNIAATTALTNAEGICTGAGQGCTLAYVSHLQSLKNDEIVLSSGKGGVVPHGFALGKVESYSPDGLYKKVQITPVLELNRLEYCILVPGNFTPTIS